MAEIPRAEALEGAGRDFETVKQILTGETDLFAQLIRQNNRRLYRVARSIVRNDAAAEDVLQEAYLLAFRRLAQYRGEGEFAAWISRIVVYQAMRVRRERARWNPLDETVETKLLADEPQETDMTLRTTLTLLVDDLPASLRPVFVLREIEGLDVSQTAASLGITEANVKVRLHRAKQQLRERLEQALGPDLAQVYGFDGARCDRIVESVMNRIHAELGSGLHAD